MIVDIANVFIIVIIVVYYCDWWITCCCYLIWREVFTDVDSGIFSQQVLLLLPGIMDKVGLCACEIETY